MGIDAKRFIRKEDDFFHAEIAENVESVETCHGASLQFYNERRNQ